MIEIIEALTHITLLVTRGNEPSGILSHRSDFIGMFHKALHGLIQRIFVTRRNDNSILAIDNNLTRSVDIGNNTG